MGVKIGNVISITLILLIVALVVCIISIDRYKTEINDNYLLFRSIENTVVGKDLTEMKEWLKSGPSAPVPDNLEE
jgi:hypothetical protein